MIEDINRNAMNPESKEKLNLLLTNPFLNPAGWAMRKAKEKKIEDAKRAEIAAKEEAEHKKRMQSLQMASSGIRTQSNVLIPVIIVGVAFIFGIGLILILKNKKK